MSDETSPRRQTPRDAPEAPALPPLARHALTLGDGAQVEVQLHAPAREGGPVVLVLPAMGVTASYYRVMAEALAAAGFGVALADLRGAGTSSVRAGRRVDFGYREHLEVDYPALVALLGHKYPKSPRILLGHSLSGQLGCLYAAAHPDAFDGLCLAACCSVWHGGWSWPQNAGIWAFVTLSEVIAVAVGHYPGHRIGFGGREARGVIRDWAHQGRTGRYEPRGATRDYEALLRQARTPLLMLSFTDDTYAPRAAVEHLLGKMPLADLTHQRVSPAEHGLDRLGHFGWARRPEVVLPRLSAWLEGRGIPAR